MRVTSNQFALLSALAASRKGFRTHRAWILAAEQLYRRWWPSGSNPVWGPAKAAPTVVRAGWAHSVREGRGKRVRLAPGGRVAMRVWQSRNEIP